MKHLDLFSGIGGFALACQWAGIDTIGFVEIDKYCQKVLRKHWPDVPIVEDIRDVEKIKEIITNTAGEGCLAERHQAGITGQAIREAPAGESSRAGSVAGIREWNRGTSDIPAILVTAGFPCQPFSVAGKRGSTEDDRYLWPETLAVIKAVNPSWVLLENVTGIINLALDTVLSDLEGAGYSTETLIIPACAVNAWHRRDRVWVVAYSEGTRARQDNGGIRQRLGGIDRGQEAVVANTSERRLEEYRDKRGSRGLYREGQPDSPCKCNSSSDWWAVKSELGGMADGFSSRLDGYWDTEPAISRVATGVKNRVDRLKCLGNAIVPSVAYEIIKVISMTGERNG